jgi:hypothetical protein
VIASPLSINLVSLKWLPGLVSLFILAASGGQSKWDEDNTGLDGSTIRQLDSIIAKFDKTTMLEGI